MGDTRVKGPVLSNFQGFYTSVFKTRKVIRELGCLGYCIKLFFLLFSLVYLTIYFIPHFSWKWLNIAKYNGCKFTRSTHFLVPLLNARPSVSTILAIILFGLCQRLYFYTIIGVRLIICPTLTELNKIPNDASFKRTPFSYPRSLLFPRQPFRRKQLSIQYGTQKQYSTTAAGSQRQLFLRFHFPLTFFLHFTSPRNSEYITKKRKKYTPCS